LAGLASAWLALAALLIGVLPADAQSKLPGTDLSISLSGPATLAPEELVDYTITITNHGPNPANSVRMSDPIPINTGFRSVNAIVGTTPFDWWRQLELSHHTPRQSKSG
jgi:uncharacterized repeat protein (TIGR01451 family)